MSLLIQRAFTDSNHKHLINIRTLSLEKLKTFFFEEANQLEQLCFEQYGQNIEIYKNRILSILHRKKFQNDYKELRWWVYSSDKEMAQNTPMEKYWKIKEKTKTSAISDTRLKKIFEVEKLEEEKEHVLSRCPMCKSTNVESEARQIRSADEGMSIFFKCRQCQHTWSQM